MVETNPTDLLEAETSPVATPVVESPTVESPTVESPTVGSPFDFEMEIGPFSPFAQQPEDPEDWFENRRRRKREEKLRQEALDTFGEASVNLGLDEIADLLQKTGEFGQKLSSKITDRFTDTITFEGLNITVDQLPYVLSGAKNIYGDVFTQFETTGYIDEAGTFVVQSRRIPSALSELAADYGFDFDFSIPGFDLTGATSDFGVAVGEKIGQYATTAVKGASVLGSIAAIDRFLEDPTGKTAAFAVGATATAASLFGSELGKNIAGMVNPLLAFYTGINVFKALTFDADYYRSQGSVTYKNGEWKTSGVQGADGGKSYWAQGQTTVAMNALNELMDDYGFEVNAAKLNSHTFKQKMLIMNNPTYAKMGNRDASLNAQQLVLSALREGVLTPTDRTPTSIAGTSKQFSDFMGSYMAKMADDYATYAWKNLGGLQDKYGSSRYGYKETYAAFGTKDAADKFAKKYNATPAKVDFFRAGAPKNFPYKPTFTRKTLKTVEQDLTTRAGAVFFGGYGFEQTDARFEVLLGSRKSKYQEAPPLYSFSSLKQAQLKVDQLNKNSKEYIFAVRRPKGVPRKYKGKDEFEVGMLDGKYVIGKRGVSLGKYSGKQKPKFTVKGTSYMDDRFYG